MERWRPGLRTGGSRAAARPGRAQLELPVRGDVRVAMSSSPVLRLVPIGFFASSQGQIGGGSTGTGPAVAWAPHRARCSTTSIALVPSLALVSQNRQPWAWAGNGYQWGPGYPGGSEELLFTMASCYLWSVWTPSARPRLQVHLVPHQHQWL